MPTKTRTKAPASPSFMNPALAPWVLISEIYWMSYKVLERRFYPLGVSASQARVLAVLHCSPEPIMPSLVATLLFLEVQTMTRLMRRIESCGWVRRMPDPHDRRAVGLELTDAGHKLAAEIVQISQELYDELFGAAFGAVEKRQIEAALRKVRALGFKLPETDFRLRQAQQYPVWKD